MNLHSLLLSSDEKTVRILRRVLSDLEIDVESCATADSAIRNLTRQRFEAIIVDCSNQQEAESVVKSARISPVNNRALAILLVDCSLGLRGGFEMGGHFVLHKPLSGERARSSFRAVRALMKRERRRQVRVPVQLSVTCQGARSSRLYNVRTIDLCEGGMAFQYSGRFINENSLRFKLELPGMNQEMELDGQLAWEGERNQAGVRFTNISDEQRFLLREWINSQLTDPEQDDPPVSCRLTDLTLGACYLETPSPFPVATRIILSMKTDDFEVEAGGIVRVMHAEFGMGVEFSQTTDSQRNQVGKMIEALRASGEKSPELHVQPDLLEALDAGGEVTIEFPATADSLLELFREKSELPIETFLEEMRQQRHMAAAK